VSAINYLFVRSSNTLGEFRAGVNADWFGAVASAMIGGIGSLLIAGAWMLIFPDLRRIDRFDPADCKPVEASMHVLITGAAGMIGRKLTTRLAIDRALGNQPIDKLTLIDLCVPERPPGFSNHVKIRAVDLSAPGAAEKTVAEQPDVIFHLAGVVSGEAETDFEKGYRVNLDGTRALLETVRAIVDYKPKFVFTSSIAVFGSPFPETIPDDFHLTPLTSYGTQKAMSELMLADYTRRGFLEGVGVRLPTICVRPGKPNKAASGFFSGIIREPLAGQEATLPVADSIMHWHASPRAAVGFLIHATGLSRAQLGDRINLTMPGVCCTVGEQIAALKRIAGDKVVARIRREPNALVERIVAGWPRRFDASRALALGFTVEASFDEIIRAHIEDELGGKIV
jgi:nucleoside-diphosphate-sugar epimerase